MADNFQAGATANYPESSPWYLAEQVSAKVVSVLSQFEGQLHTRECSGGASDQSKLTRETWAELEEAFKENDLEPQVLSQIIRVTKEGEPEYSESIVQAWVWVFHRSSDLKVDVDFSGPNSVIVRGGKERLQNFLDTLKTASWESPPVESSQGILQTQGVKDGRQFKTMTAAEPEPKLGWARRHLAEFIGFPLIVVVVGGGILKLLGWV